eukprot:2990576-Rhodomonas_salina.1
MHMRRARTADLRPGVVGRMPRVWSTMAVGLLLVLCSTSVQPSRAVHAEAVGDSALSRGGLQTRVPLGRSRSVVSYLSALHLKGGFWNEGEEFDPAKLKEIGNEVLKMWEVSAKETKREQAGLNKMDEGKVRFTDVTAEDPSATDTRKAGKTCSTCKQWSAKSWFSKNQ